MKPLAKISGGNKIMPVSRFFNHKKSRKKRRGTPTARSTPSSSSTPPMTAVINGEETAWLKELLEAMMARKQEAFADNNWMVREYEIVGEGPQAMIKVSSTMLLPHLNS